MINRPPKVSVVIPVCDDEQYLTQCIESVTSQTLRSIEIICVEDASNDGSYELLLELVRKHPAHKFKIIKHESRMSASQCRKDGALASEGEYVIFLDSDDYLEPDTCQLAYENIVKNRTDILQYGTVVENCANVPAWRINLNQKALNPYVGGVLTGNLLKACFVEKKFSVNTVNKMFRGDVCRRAFANVEDGVFHYAEDLYALFNVLLIARSYSAIDKKLYHYCFGRGSVGKSEIDIETFKHYCQSAKVIEALKRTLNDVN